jgi:hypothetical protein
MRTRNGVVLVLAFDVADSPGAADAPDTAFVDSNCDGIDGDAAHAVFARQRRHADARRAETRCAAHAPSSWLSPIRPSKIDVGLDLWARSREITLSS